ncbi:HNH endonuclease signature motif containing protein [soil metagenome]
MIELGLLQAQVRDLPTPRLSDAERIDLLRGLEELKCIAEAAQAALSADCAESQEAKAGDAGVPAERRGRGIASQIALARRESPHKAQRHLGLARILPTELPHTWAAFQAGRITEWRATLIARETACLALEQRLEIDERLAGDPDRLEAMGDGEISDAAVKLAAELDPASVAERRRRAEEERRVSLRPAPDVMSQLSALLPVKDGVSVFAALKAAADTAIGQGDPRTRGQVMADTLVARITGRDPLAEDADPGVTVDVILPDTVLTGQSDAGAHIDGYGPIPADLARDLAARATWLRRLYADVHTGALTAMESKRRLVPDGMAKFLRFRDRTCRTPWCDAPVRHSDHVQSVEEHGPTSVANAQGLCQACNHAKQAPGWTARPRPGPVHTVQTTTPTGHTYTSTAPPARERVWVETEPGTWTLIA